MRQIEWRIAVVLAALAAAEVADAKSKKMGDIQGWAVTGPGDGAKDFELTDYDGGLDRKVKHSGKASAYLRSRVKKPAKHAVVMQSIRSHEYRGKRIRVAAWIKTRDVAEAASLWVRVTPKNRDETLARAVASAKGTTDWKRYEVVLDVPSKSELILYGLALQGTGKAWIDDMTWEIVDWSVPVTSGAPLEPSNLGFEEAR